MKGDFSRSTYNQKKHYRRVLMQQGRVEVDADPNEQIAIDEHLERATNYDVIGPSGAPLAVLPDGTAAGGFEVAVNAAGTDLTISPGRMYVEGVLIENELPGGTYLHQPDRPFPAGTSLANDPDLSGPGVYVVYVDVWERLVTFLDDPEIREAALGGPDHSVRSKIVWQVKLARAGALGAPITCASVGDSWRPSSKNQGTMAAGTAAPLVAQIPCILPPETGYRRLENQLYRVEIHQPGGFGAATFKWSRENGSVVVGIVAPAGANPPPPTVVGPAFSVTSTGRDDTLGFKTGDIVELLDDRSELINGHGELLQIQSVDTANLLITTTKAAANPVDLSLHPKLRRWDQTGGANFDLPITDPGWIQLEEGVQVQFFNGQFNTGDYWLIPARTKTSVQTGQVEWPVDPATSNPVALPPRGIIHHYANLALVSFDGKVFSNPVVCRPTFPPLTQLQPCDNASPCTIIVRPGSGWEQPVLALFKDPQKSVDAEICFPVGEFPLTAPLAIQNSGNIKISGAGWGTRLIGDALESVMRFQGCASVVVCDLAAISASVDGAGQKQINGTLEFVQCQNVLVEDVFLQCGSGGNRGAACLTVRNAFTNANATSGSGSVRIRGSRLVVGEMQFGLLLVHVARATIEDNEISAVTQRVFKPLVERLKDPIFRSMARTLLVSGLTIKPLKPAPAPAAVAAPPAAGAPATQPAPEPPVPGLITLTFGTRQVSFKAHPGLKATWQAFVDRNAPKSFATDQDIRNFIISSATRVLTDPAARQQLAGFGGIMHLLGQVETRVIARGIVIGGRTIQDLQITGNSISGAQQAITVGVSHEDSSNDRAVETPDRAGSVKIVGNVMGVMLNSLAQKRARHAIFVGNVDSLLIESNRAIATLPNPPIAADGIRVFGYLGKKMIVRHNHLTGFSPGVMVHVLSGPNREITSAPIDPRTKQPSELWLIADNVFDHSISNNSPTGFHAPACRQSDNVFTA